MYLYCWNQSQMFHFILLLQYKFFYKKRESYKHLWTAKCQVYISIFNGASIQFYSIFRHISFRKLSVFIFIYVKDIDYLLNSYEIMSRANIVNYTVILVRQSNYYILISKMFIYLFLTSMTFTDTFPTSTWYLKGNETWSLLKRMTFAANSDVAER